MPHEANAMTMLQSMIKAGCQKVDKPTGDRMDGLVTRDETVVNPAMVKCLRTGNFLIEPINPSNQLAVRTQMSILQLAAPQLGTPQFLAPKAESIQNVQQMLPEYNKKDAINTIESELFWSWKCFKIIHIQLILYHLQMFWPEFATTFEHSFL